jgi:hypothetical protein
MVAGQAVSFAEEVDMGELSLSFVWARLSTCFVDASNRSVGWVLRVEDTILSFL